MWSGQGPPSPCVYPSRLDDMLTASEVPRLAVVELTNIRGFDKLTLTLATADAESPHKASPREQGAVVIGRNGTNKSTLLRAIAIGVASQSDASAMLSVALGSLIRTGTSHGRIRLTYAFETGKQLSRRRRSFDHVARTMSGPPRVHPRTN